MVHSTTFYWGILVNCSTLCTYDALKFQWSILPRSTGGHWYFHTHVGTMMCQRTDCRARGTLGSASFPPTPLQYLQIHTTKLNHLLIKPQDAWWGSMITYNMFQKWQQVIGNSVAVWIGLLHLYVGLVAIIPSTSTPQEAIMSPSKFRTIVNDEKKMLSDLLCDKFEKYHQKTIIPTTMMTGTLPLQPMRCRMDLPAREPDPRLEQYSSLTISLHAHAPQKTMNASQVVVVLIATVLPCLPISKIG